MSESIFREQSLEMGVAKVPVVMQMEAWDA